MAYIFGLGLTIFIMHIFKHAQVSSTLLPPVDAQVGQASLATKFCILPGKSRFIPLLLALIFQCLPVPFPVQSSCAQLEQRPVWSKAPCCQQQPLSQGPCVFWLFAAKLP